MIFAYLPSPEYQWSEWKRGGYQRAKLAATCQRWRSIVEPTTFNTISIVCQTYDDVDMICSTLGKAGRVNHVRSLTLQFVDFDPEKLFKALTDIMDMLSSGNQDPGMWTAFYFESMDKKIKQTWVPADTAMLLSSPFPKARCVKDLQVDTWDHWGSPLLALRLAESTPCAVKKSLALEVGHEDIDQLSKLNIDWCGDSTKQLLLGLYQKGEAIITPTEYGESSDYLTRKLHEISLGLEKLTISYNSEIGIGIFGQDTLGSATRTAARWPRLERFWFDYDQCVVDELKIPPSSKLDRIVLAGLGAARLCQAQDRIWEAATIAAQHMPNLRKMVLHSGSRMMGPEFEVTKTHDSVCVTWSWYSTEQKIDWARGWSPNDNTLDMWRAFAKKQNMELTFRMIRDEGKEERVWN
ncbi:Chitinase [Apiospora arundinis]